MSFSKQFLRAATTVCAVCSMAFLAAVAHGDGNGSPPPSGGPGEGIPQVSAIEEEAQDALAILDQTRVASDAMPTEVAEDLDADADFGMNPELSRESIGNISHSVYVIPANGHVCWSLTVGDGANISCDETEHVVEGTTAPTTVVLEGGDIAVYGIVPDGVGSVTIETGISDADELDVSENAYYVVVPSGTALRTLGYAGPSGYVEYPIYDPTEVFEE
jgi:hypothetical protein